MAEDELVIPGSRRKAGLVLFIAIGLVAVGVFLIRIGEPWGWAMVGLFGLAIPITLWMLGANNSYLKLDRNGLEIKTLWKPRQIKWMDVEGFFVMTQYGNKMIGIRYSSSYRGLRIGRMLASVISGVEGALPDQFQAPPEEICDKLNQWKAKFGGVRE